MLTNWRLPLMLALLCETFPGAVLAQVPPLPSSAEWGLAPDGPCEADRFKGPAAMPTVQVRWRREQGRVVERTERAGHAGATPDRKERYRYHRTSGALESREVAIRDAVSDVWSSEVTRYQQDAAGRPAGEEVRTESGTILSRSRLERDAQGRLQRSIFKPQTGPAQIDHFRWNDAGQLAQQSHVLGDSQTPEWTIRYEYDANGRLSAIRHSRDGTTSFTWNDAGRLVKRERTGVKTGKRLELATYRYDSMGRLIGETWERNRWPRPSIERIQYRYGCD